MKKADDVSRIVNFKWENPKVYMGPHYVFGKNIWSFHYFLSKKDSGSDLKMSYLFKGQPSIVSHNKMPLQIGSKWTAPANFQIFKLLSSDEFLELEARTRCKMTAEFHTLQRIHAHVQF